MKKFLKRTLAVFLTAVMVLGAAPLAGFVGLELPEIGGIKKFADSVSGFFDGFAIKAEAAPYSGKCGDNLTYSYDTKTCVLTITGTGDMYDDMYLGPEWNEGAGCSEIILPQGLTSIGNNAFTSNWFLKKIIIPDSVTSIGDNAFRSCWEASEIVLPKSLNYIGDYAFYACASYGFTSESSKIIIPNGVTDIGDFAFGDCYGATFSDLPDSVVNIGAGAFHDCNKIETITIPEGCKTIGAGAFTCIDGLKTINYNAIDCEISDETPEFFCSNFNENGDVDYSVSHGGGHGIFMHGAGSFSASFSEANIGSSVKTIPDYLFYNCSSIPNITIPDSVISIGDGAFSYATVDGIPEGVAYIGDYAFLCGKINNFVNLSGIESINNGVFEECRINGDVYTDGVKSIGDYVFESSFIFGTLNISETVRSIGEGAFYCCSPENFSVNPQNSLFSSDNSGLLLSKDKSYLIRYPKLNTRENFIIPDSITSIGDYAFYECSRLTSVTIGNSVTSIGEHAFHYCTGLTSIIIGNSVTSIGDYVFYECDSLTSITIPDNVTSIGESAFDSCIGLTSVTIPDSVTSIGDYAFRYCDGITDVYYTGTETEWNAISIGSENGCLTNATIHYNYKSVAVTGIDIHETKIQMNGKTMVIGATVYPENATNQKVKWSSSNPDVAAIDATNGTLTAKANGYTVVIARTVDGNYSDSCIVFVGENTMVVSSEDGNEIKKGDTHKIYVSLVDPDCISMSDSGVEIESISDDPIDKTIFAVENSSVATIKSISNRTNNGRILEIKGVSPGTTYITMTNNDTGEVKYLPIYVLPNENTYTTETIPATDEGHRGIKNFRHNGIYIYDYVYLNNGDGSVRVSFTAYNNNTNNGSIEIYDEDGKLVKSYMLEAHNGGDPTSVDENCEMIGAVIVTWVNLDPFDPTSKVSSTKTEVDCTVPQNGYIKITNDVADSKICLAYNIMDFVISTVSLSGDITGFADLDSETAKKVVEKTSEKVIEAIVDTSGSLIEKIIGKIIDELSKPETLENRENLFDLVEQLLDILDLKFEEILVESIWDVTKKKITDLVLDALGTYGKIVKGLYAYNAFLQIYNLIDSCNSSTGSYSAYIYAKQNGDKKVSNSIIFKGDSDAETVFRTYAIAYGDIYVEMSTLYGAEDMELYDISLVKDGNTVQPSEKVQVSIPIPKDWDKNKVKVYRVTLDGAYMQYEDMKGKVDGNYIVFETDHFSYYAIVEETSGTTDPVTPPAIQPTVSIVIRKPSTTTISYGDSIVLHADAESIPAGGYVEWTASNGNFAYTESADGATCTITPVSSGDTTFTATVYDAQGNAVSKDEQTMTSKAGFFDKIIAFFKKIFGMNKIIEQGIRSDDNK